MYQNHSCRLQTILGHHLIKLVKRGIIPEIIPNPYHSSAILTNRNENLNLLGNVKLPLKILVICKQVNENILPRNAQLLEDLRFDVIIEREYLKTFCLATFCC